MASDRLAFVGVLLAAGGLVCIPQAAAAKPSAAGRCIDAGELGQRLRDEGKYLDARREFAICASEECPQMLRQDCSGWAAEVEKATPSIVVAVRDETGADFGDARTTLDTTVVRERLDGRPIELDPGKHTLAIEAAGRRVQREIVVAAGEKNRLVVVTLARRAEPAPETATAARPPRTPQRSHTLPIALAALSGVALGSFVGFGLDGMSDRSRLKGSACAQTRTCSSAEVDSIRTRFIVADVSLLVAIVSAGAATWLFLAPPAGPSPRAE